MKCQKELPKGYKLIKKIDIENDKKLFVGINAFAVLICILFLAMPAFNKTITIDIDFPELLKGFAITAILAVVYIATHELIHGVFIRIFTKHRPYYGFTKGMFYAATKYYIPKIQYLVIALAPVVIWGVVLHILYMNLSGYLFWVFYLIQMLNISGASGDFYVTYITLKMPKDMLSKDVGAAMEFYGGTYDI